jgi:hypothetical protein
LDCDEDLETSKILKHKREWTCIYEVTTLCGPSLLLRCRTKKAKRALRQKETSFSAVVSEDIKKRAIWRLEVSQLGDLHTYKELRDIHHQTRRSGEIQVGGPNLSQLPAIPKLRDQQYPN